MDGEEYEVESVTRARVHDKRGKKITWRYYVKWKGYDWNENTWEPTESFQGGSEHILEAFWERIDTNGRDISDASSFKKGEELFISGPPGKKALKRKANGSKAEAAPEINTAANPVSISAPLPTPGKRRRTQAASDDEDDIEESKPKRQAKTAIAPPRPNRRASMGGQKNAGVSAKASKRRRASSPGLRKQAPKRMPSAGDSQLDADGETDPDVIEVEDELMLGSGEDVEDGAASRDHPASARTNGLKNIVFDDLEPFYSGNPIDIDQPTDESVQQQKPAAEARPQTPSSASPAPERHHSEPEVPEDRIPEPQGPEHHTPEPQVPGSPPRASPDPLFDSPSHFSERIQEIRRESPLPFHRARAAKPLVKLIDPPTTEKKDTQSRITAKARLMSLPQTSTGGPSGQTARRAGKPGPGRSSAGMITKNRSSLLTSTNGILQSVRGKFATTNAERNQPDEIEEVPVGASEERRFVITSWSDESNTKAPLPQSSSAPTAGQLKLTLAGLQKHAEELSDYEEDDDTARRFKVTGERQGSSTIAIAGDKLPGEASSHAVEVHQAGDRPMESTPAIAEPKSQGSNAIVADKSVPSVGVRPFEELIRKNIELARERLFPHTIGGKKSVSSVIIYPSEEVVKKNTELAKEQLFASASNTLAADKSASSVVTSPFEELIRKNIELAKEQLFPSTRTSFSTPSDIGGSFRSTIFGPLYQGIAVGHSSTVENEPSSTFRLILNDNVQLPLVLKDRNQLKARISDIMMDKSSGGKRAVFYGSEDAAAIVDTLKSGGTARVVLDSSAEPTQKARFTTLLQRFESSHTLIAPVDKAICVLYLSDNTSVAEKLDAPAHLRGLTRTLLISHASIENQFGYVAAIMQASPFL